MKPPPMNTDPTHTFNALRPRLQGIAYRMLGSMAEAEEVVQDVWLRWHDAGFWLPEPMLSESPATPEQMLARADEVSLAFLILLERLAPEARAAFLLREVFDCDYVDVARTIGKSEAACRQLVSRAKTQLQDQRPRYAVTPDTHFKLLSSFAEAMTGGDFAALKAMLADGAELIGDGGGKVPSFGKPLLGGRRIAQLFYATSLKMKTGLRIQLARINGEWGLLRFIDGALESAQQYETDGERILRIHVQRNPDKLARIAAQLADDTRSLH